VLLYRDTKQEDPLQKHAAPEGSSLLWRDAKNMHHVRRSQIACGAATVARVEPSTARPLSEPFSLGPVDVPDGVLDGGPKSAGSSGIHTAVAPIREAVAPV
jgi:hypothetical protein